MMTLSEAIDARHSVRRYLNEPLTADQAAALQAAVERINREAGLHVQLVLNEPRGFSTGLAYGTFKGVGNYLVMAGRKAPDLNERVGYYGEQLVLLAWQLGLGSCWAGLTYRSVKDAYRLEPGEKVVCMIALGHPDDERRRPRRKRAEQVSNVSDLTPAWFRQGVEAAIKAPTAVHQQKFYLEYLDAGQGLPRVRARRLFSLVGYTQTDLGIVKLHFEIGAGRENFAWAD